jgi:precorrin-6A/cobalt-precorrin-6A reductase
MRKTKRVLILGGTDQGWQLAAQAATIPDLEVFFSLAGRTRQPMIPIIQTRIGGFGGIPGLRDYLQQEKIDFLINATHPFATQISQNAAIAASSLVIPYLRLLRPAWQKSEQDNWIEVESYEAAVSILSPLAQRVFLSIGRQELAIFSTLPDRWFLMRMVEPPSLNGFLPQGKVLLARGPFDLDEERSLLQTYKIEVIVSKNSGGNATYPKILAARELGIPVIMVQRPELERGETVAEIKEAIAWLKNKLENDK